MSLRICPLITGWFNESSYNTTPFDENDPPELPSPANGDSGGSALGAATSDPSAAARAEETDEEYEARIKKSDDAAIVGSAWLFEQERMKMARYNGNIDYLERKAKRSISRSRSGSDSDSDDD